MSKKVDYKFKTEVESLICTCISTDILVIHVTSNSDFNSYEKDLWYFFLSTKCDEIFANSEMLVQKVLIMLEYIINSKILQANTMIT